MIRLHKSVIMPHFVRVLLRFDLRDSPAETCFQCGASWLWRYFFSSHLTQYFSKGFYFPVLFYGGDLRRLRGYYNFLVWGVYRHLSDWCWQLLDYLGLCYGYTPKAQI